jgi:N-methylhydantoinase A
MVSAIKEISIAKGYDPREFTLLAYGGAGPMHAAYIADELDITHVIVPPSPGNFSAFGCLVSDLHHNHLRTRVLETRRHDWSEVARIFVELEEQGRVDMRVEGIEDECIDIRRELGMRYVGQSWELVVEIDRDVDSMQRLESVFRAAHEMRYGHSVDEPMEIVTVRVVALGRMAKPRLSALGAELGVDEADPKRRDVYFDGGYRPTEVHVRDSLVPGISLPGPLLVEEMGAMTVVPPAWTLSVGELGEFHLHRNP